MKKHKKEHTRGKRQGVISTKPVEPVKTASEEKKQQTTRDKARYTDSVI